jgi:hypothetical protein
MSKLIKAKIDVKKINKDLLFTGTKGTYLDIDIWINDKPDQYGNDVSIEQSVKKDEPKIYIGNGKMKWKSGAKSEPEQSGSATKEAIVNKSKEQNQNADDLPW